MTSTIQTKIKNKLLQIFNLQVLSMALLAFSAGAVNAATDLGTSPLVSSTTSNVLPNLMYILDNSGSMGWDYMPDYVNDSNKCKSTSTTGEFSAGCTFGDPPYNAREFNSIYYNPAITYSPGLNADGSEKKSMTSANTSGWTAVPNDAYGIQSNTNTSLVPTSTNNSTGYPDRVWCNTSSASTADLINPLVCKKNSQYIYPNNTGTTSTSYNNPYTLRGYPYYYTVAAGEYCTNKNLTSCVVSTVPTGAYTFPATLRWCNSSARTNCQAKYLEPTNYTFAKWSGITNATSATGKIKIDADSLGLASPVSLSVTGITVNGISIIPAVPSPALTITNTTNNTQRNTLATNIAAAINAFASAPDFTATASADEVTITNAVAGAFTGTIVVTTTSYTGPATAGVKATGSFQVTSVGNSGTTKVGSITVNGIEIMGGSGAGCGEATYTPSGSPGGSTRRNALASAIVTKINSCTSSPEYTAVSDGASNPKITITASAVGAASNGAIVISTLTNSPAFGTFVPLAGGDNGAPKTYTIPTTLTQISGGTPVANSFSRVDIVPTTPTYAKAGTRTDCGAGTTCTYDQEMTNFANWYSYYRTRMQMMKTSTSRAFKTIDTRFRVGFITINNPSSNYLPINQFNATQKADWYDILLAANPGNSTPLRTALTTVGRIFAGKKPVGSDDPVQYSCQQNFALLTTDGYWNSDTASSVKNISGSGSVGNMDGGTTPRPMYEGPVGLSNSLADAAKYYYDTDLRQGTFPTDAICRGGTRPDGSTGDVCTNNVFVTPTDNNINQHMTTFTLGLGVDATLAYTTDYKTATSGDFYELKQGTLDWPVPAADSQTAVDDLWHAAVNGQGTYFSAKNPNQLATSLSEALNSIKSKVGAGAAAATSTLNQVSGDNYTYVASYTSVKWIGNLEARSVNTDTGKVSEAARWCLENVVEDTCAAPSSIVATANGNSTTYQCVTPSATAATCAAPGILDGTNCKVEISTSCTGTMQTKVNNTIATENPDTRNIYMNVNGVLGDFTSANLGAAGKNANFGNAFLATKLSQWSSLTADQKALVDSSSLVNFLRGNTGFEDRASNSPPDTAADNRIYRLREATLGDLVDSTPVYVGVPTADFSDPGYGTASTVGSFKATYADRPGTVYIGANDGMLHAINADDTSADEGKERWAYVPSMVLDNMWKLASNDYSNSHTYYMNGDIVVNDVCTANCTSASSAVWKTVLVAGLNGGGKGYFALDITNPNSPVLLWEFDAADDSDIGYSYGNPMVTKKADGTWVVLLTSGYNNTNGSNPGIGYLYVLNAGTGAVISKYETGVGSSTTPSGLAKINAFVADGAVNNTVTFVYGGDLLGNVWRFDINSPQSSTNPFKVAVLKDPSGTVQPITVRPELAEINGKTILYVGTGRYLGISDLADTQQQSIYAISDDVSGTPATLDNPRVSPLMVNQVLVNDTATATRHVQQPANTVNFATGRGWYIDFPDSGERQNVPAQLVFGTLLLPTTVPSNTICSPGGTGWLNFLDYRTGAAVSGNIVASKTNAPIVGINVLYVKGKPVVNIVTADNPTPQFPAVQPPFTGGAASGFTNHRVIWRELIDEQ
ncbi:MAG: PilC/PilY family type IV pilus protein [Methylotenera sp.]